MPENTLGYFLEQQPIYHNTYFILRQVPRRMLKSLRLSVR